ncbi:MAG: Uma2 family endonuclease [Desulfobacterales bacterium]|nr:Uma2 family endonuclease [Desulfobacterales bacterium]
MGTAQPVLHDYEEHDSAGDEYYYGHRTVIEYDEKGNCRFRYLPLTPDDFLDPEEGDVYMEGNLHERDVDRLKSIFRFHLKDQEDITVYSNLKIIWGIDGLSEPAPDISILRDVTDPEKPRDAFHVPEERTKPFFVMEVVAPRYRNQDISKKPEIYRKAGVSEYIIADPGLKQGKISYTAIGYRLIGNRYIKMKPDSQGRLRSMTADILLGTAESGTRLVVYNALTGEEILSGDERAEQEKARADSAKARADQEKVRADSAKARADQEENRADQKKNRAKQEKARADSAEEELMRLKAEMKALGLKE